MRGLALLLVSVVAAPAVQADEGVRGVLAEAVELYRRARAEAALFTVDPNERALLVGPVFFEGADTPEAVEVIFRVGDEAFEREFERSAGLGQGPAHGPLPGPARVQRIHTGERGGLDASACRSCHFVGGVDGAGTLTQVGLFRGDGRHLSSAVLRDSPHVMGLGYLAALAREMEAELASQIAAQREGAEYNAGPVRFRLRAKGVDFGTATVDPDGTVALDGLQGISPDLKVRPFGWKGRHAELVALCDEALQTHLGLQSQSRIEDFSHDPEGFLGPGPPWDPDDDGVSFEANAGQAMLLAAYLSQLGTPQVRPAADPRLAVIQARGRAVFDQVGCAACHRPVLYLSDTVTRLRSRGEAPFEYAFDLATAGQDPRPLRVDPGEGPDGGVPGGVPVYAFTDLRRHDLGPELAEARPEVLPDGQVVDGAVWLTRPLWGLADTAPYLHDGRALTVHDAIGWHGGAAAESRAAYAALPAADQGALRVFLMSLTRPPSLVVE